MQHTRLETFHQSRVVVVVVVMVVVGGGGGSEGVVRAYFPMTGNRGTPRDEVGPMNTVVAHSGPLSCCS